MMFAKNAATAQADRGMLDALDRVMAVISFTPEGAIIDANANFSAAMGYQLAEIRGQHHRMFMPAGTATSDDYRRFWEESLDRLDLYVKELKRKEGRNVSRRKRR